MRLRTTGGVVAVMGAIGAALAAPAVAGKDDLVFVSRASGADGQPAAKRTNNDQASISGSGSRVAFRSDAKNISKADNDKVSDIFVRDVAAKETILVSRASGKKGDPGGGLSQQPAISSDGRYVAFDSLSDNLTINDAESTHDIFVRDLKKNTTTVASLRTGPPGNVLDPVTSNEDSLEPAISAHGRFVAFTSREELVPEDTNDYPDIYVRDMVANTTRLASRANGPNGAVSDGLSSEPAISPGGTLVAFTTLSATNLGSGLPANAPNNSQVYVRDMVAGTTRLVSRANGANGAVGDRQSSHASLSNTGLVAFGSTSENLSSIGDAATSNVFVRNLAANTTTIVSVPATKGGPGIAGGSRNPEISVDGKNIAFESGADDMSGQDDNLYENVFVRDLAKKKTIYVNRRSGPHGKPGQGTAGDASISKTGLYVAFVTDAGNISKQDNNQAYSNVFRRQIR
jgi:Tol biopolymer transport system component